VVNPASDTRNTLISPPTR